MMFVDNLYLSFMIVLFFDLTLTQAIEKSPTNATLNSFSTLNSTINGNVTKAASFIQHRVDQGKDILHDAFAKMDRGTIVRGTIVLAGITCLVLMYIGLKTFL